MDYLPRPGDPIRMYGVRKTPSRPARAVPANVVAQLVLLRLDSQSSDRPSPIDGTNAMPSIDMAREFHTEAGLCVHSTKLLVRLKVTTKTVAAGTKYQDVERVPSPGLHSAMHLSVRPA